MKKHSPLLLLLILATACTSTKNLTYLNNLPATTEPQFFPYEMPEYKVQHRDILYIDVKSLTPDGKIENVLQGSSSLNQNYIQGEANQYLLGYGVDKDGRILLPVIGKISVQNKNLNDIRIIIQNKVDSIFNHAYVDVKLLSFKFSVLGEVRNPGTFVNYNDFLTIIEGISRAGGVGDYGRRDNVLVIRSTPEGSKVYRINLQDKSILTSDVYFLLPNDVIIIEPLKHKSFTLNLPSISLAVSSITGILTTTLLLINFFSTK